MLRYLAAFLLLAAPQAGADSGDPPKPATEWVVRTWQTNEGLPQNTVNALAQTRDGFLWIGTNGGLARFDGMQFRTYGLLDGLGSVRVSALAEDSQGALWIATSGGGVSCLSDGRITTYGTNQGLPNGADIPCIATTPDGSVWAGTTAGLFKWNGRSFLPVGDMEGLPRKSIKALGRDSKGALWVSVLWEGVFRQVDGRFQSTKGIGPAPADAYSLLGDRDGSVWAGYGNGEIWHWRDDAWQKFDTANGLPNTNFWTLAQNSDGTLWIGANPGGLYRSIGQGYAPAVDLTDLPDQRVRAVLTDREGCVWVGTGSGGLTRLSCRILQYRSTGSGSNAKSVTSVAEVSDGELLLSTGANGFGRFQNGEYRRVEEPSIRALPAFVYCSTIGADGSIWAAGEQFLVRIQDGKATKVFSDETARSEAIRALCVDGETLWLGTYYGTLLKCDGTNLQVVVPRGTFQGDITSIVCEAPEVLWIGTSGGLHRWDHGQIRTWDRRDGFLSPSAVSLLRDADGTLWIGTMGGGLSRMKDGKIRNITTREGLIDDTVTQIVADDFGALWLGCNRGIMRLDRREIDSLLDGKTHELYPMNFGRNEGMLKEQCSGGHSPTAIKTRDGRLVFPTMGGIAEIDPRQLHRSMKTPLQASIESMAIDGRVQVFGRDLVIPAGQHRIELKFTAAALEGGEWLHFHHRLEGLDPNWLPASSSRVASYDGLNPGKYIFRVAVADELGNWGDRVASIPFVIKPFYWQTAWFRAGAILSLIALASTAAWWHGVRKHSRQLAEMERARQQQAELARVSRVSLLGELSASLAHELNQPLTAILSNAQAAIRFLQHEPADVEEVRASLLEIADADKRASEIITRMRAMMKKGESQLEPRNLNADIEQVLLLLHSDLVTRKVDVETCLSPALPLVNGDHVQLQQVLLNLVVNGCDAMQERSPDERRLTIETSREGDGLVRVSVIDRGSGIAPEMLQRIFEPFFSTKSAGLGMGLSICQAIVKAHGGRLWASNNADRGAAFHFTIREFRGKRV